MQKNGLSYPDHWKAKRGNEMGITTILGIIVGFGSLIVAFMMDGGSLSSLALPSPFLIVIGGTLGALMVSFSLKDVTKIPKLLMAACKSPKKSLNTSLELLVNLATSVRREGILCLERLMGDGTIDKKQDPLLQRGIMLLLDGLDKQALKGVLDSEVYIFEQVRKREISIFEQAGGFSPTMGIIGTVLGLIHVLGNMSSPEELAKSIAVAFIATLYGVGFANLIWLPIANKLKLQMKIASIEKELIIEGVLSIHEGENPMIIRERLKPYVAFEMKTVKEAKEKNKVTTAKEEGL